MFPVHKILHPTDFSKQSEAAFKLAAALARDYDSKLVVLHVATPPPVVADGEVVTVTNPADYYEQLWESLHQYKTLETGMDMELLLEEGFPAGTILQVAADNGCDMIVMGTHGRSGVGRLLMGSVAEQVIRKATCPVLTIKFPAAKKATAPARVEEEVPVYVS
jgi:nucleotide-binding universal stress UspA family protein